MKKQQTKEQEIEREKSLGGQVEQRGIKWRALVVVIAVISLGFIFYHPAADDRGGKVENKQKQEGGGVQLIQVDQYDQIASRDEVFVLDVHVPEQKHLPGTDAFIPFDRLSQRVGDLPADKNTPILVYCRSGGMSRQASAELFQMGYKTVYDLAGGARAYNVAIDNKVVGVKMTPGKQALGTVVYGEVAKTQFKVVNNTDRPIKIEQVSTSCGCTKAKVAKKNLAAHESTEVTVTFDPAVHKDWSDLGEVTRTIFIETNHPQYKEVTAEITAKVIKKTS